MADFETNLITYLTSKAPITSLIGVGDNARIYLGFPKQGAALPYIVFEIFEGSSAEHLTAISGIASNRVQIDCYASTKAGSKTLAELVRLAPMQMYRGTMGTMFSNGITSPGGFRRGYDSPAQGSNQARFWTSRDYFINYEEAIS